MRPVDKGAAPALYANYREAGSDLQIRLGDYCSYCERQIETHLAVEHVQPKSHVPALATIWSNFLLGCVHCNSSKGDAQINLPDYFWPDNDNTLLAFEYIRGGLVESNPALPTPTRATAQATIELVGLDKDPGNPRLNRRPSTSDRRWLRRVQAWQLAEECRQRLAVNNSQEVRALIVENALGRGMFSIWWTVFAGEVDMRRRLRQAFLGTDPASFDATENVQPRAGGQV